MRRDVKAGKRTHVVAAVKVSLLGDERAAAGQDPGDLSRAERLVPAGDPAGSGWSRPA
jgi:hypothetical protein